MCLPYLPFYRTLKAQFMRILLVEDEEKVANFIRKGLEQSAYSVHWVGTGEEGYREACYSAYDAIILDLMLPGVDGLQIVRNLRQFSCSVPVIALTARDSLDDRIAGLEAGCDDYLPKPFAFEELLARLRALLRRKDGRPTPSLSYGGIVIEPVTRRVARDGVPIYLTNREYALLMLFMREPGRVFTKEAILKSIWGYDYDASSNVLQVYMMQLRKKIDTGFPFKLLHTVSNAGYMLRELSLRTESAMEGETP